MMSVGFNEAYNMDLILVRHTKNREMYKVSKGIKNINNL